MQERSRGNSVADLFSIVERRKQLSIVRRNLAVLALLALTTSCSHQVPVLSPTSVAASSQPPSFNQDNSEGNASPTHSLVNTVLPRGTALVVRLQSSLSSAVAHPGDPFTAVLDQPIAWGGETLAPRGALVSGRVVLANRTGNAYLELTLSSVDIGGKTIVVHTSAVFVKSSPHPSVPVETADHRIQRPIEGVSEPGAQPNENAQAKFSTGRQLVFWLVQSLPITS